jgi:hypothetical protein
LEKLEKILFLREIEDEWWGVAQSEIGSFKEILRLGKPKPLTLVRRNGYRWIILE